jgi:hypothetical protein
MANHALRLVWLGQAHLLSGRPEVAIELARRALQDAEGRRERGQQAYALRLVADVAAQSEMPDVSTGEATYRRALVLAQDLGMQPLVAQCGASLERLHRRTSGEGGS